MVTFVLILIEITFKLQFHFSEREDGDDVKGHHFTPSRNFVRKAAQSIMSNVTETTQAAPNYTSTYDAKLANETGTKHLNVALVYAGGLSFFLRLGPNKTVDIYMDAVL